MVSRGTFHSEMVPPSPSRPLPRDGLAARPVRLSLSRAFRLLVSGASWVPCREAERLDGSNSAAPRCETPYSFTILLSGPLRSGSVRVRHFCASSAVTWGLLPLAPSALPSLDDGRAFEPRDPAKCFIRRSGASTRIEPSSNHSLHTLTTLVARIPLLVPALLWRREVGRLVPCADAESRERIEACETLVRGGNATNAAYFRMLFEAVSNQDCEHSNTRN